MVFSGPTLNFGTATGYLWLGNVMGVVGTSSITGSNGVVVTSMSGDGQNELRLQNTVANPFSGGLYIAGTARVRFNTADDQLGAAGRSSLRGGTCGTTARPRSSLSTSVDARPIELHLGGRRDHPGREHRRDLTVPGLVSGTEQLTTTGAGSIFLAKQRQHLFRRHDHRRREPDGRLGGEPRHGQPAFGVQIGATT